ncbi:shikimate kinase [Leucobacter viscericola]|uniref:shikimate kinase n=1 Tax=Leucobacter viscericola TaxID=2714935 RepID=UPI001FCBC29C|nr:shikimate kinase [Leucobacter viscericola]
MTGSRRVHLAAGAPLPEPDPTLSAEPTPKPKPPPPTSPILLPGSVDGAAQEEPATGGRSGNRRRRRRKRGPKLPDRVIVFVGPMAAGKTSLGKRVARELGVPFVDSDAVFVRQHGPITAFFETHGEEDFRRIEAELIAAELATPGVRVLALGGGAVLTDSTRELLSGFPVVLLTTTQEAVLRTANIQRRPLLRNDPNAWNRIFEERRPLYEEVADVSYRTDRATKEQLARRVTQWARSFRKDTK